jgi:hypothetical protein
MAIYSVVFLYIFRTQAYYYKTGASAVPLGHGGYQGGFLGTKAILEALNPFDIIRGIFSLPMSIANRKAGSVPANKAWATGSGPEVSA